MILDVIIYYSLFFSFSPFFSFPLTDLCPKPKNIHFPIPKTSKTCGHKECHENIHNNIGDPPRIIEELDDSPEAKVQERDPIEVQHEVWCDPSHNQIHWVLEIKLGVMHRRLEEVSGQG